MSDRGRIELSVWFRFYVCNYFVMLFFILIILSVSLLVKFFSKLFFECMMLSDSVDFVVAVFRLSFLFFYCFEFFFLGLRGCIFRNCFFV